MIVTQYRKSQHLRGICRASLWSAIARGTKNICDQPTHGSFLCTFWNFDWQAFFIGILSIQCKIRRDRPTDTRRSTGRSRSTCWPRL